MAVKNYYIDFDMNAQEVRNFTFEMVAADPGTNLYDGRLIYNTTDKRMKHYDSGSSLWRSVVHLQDLEQFSAYVGGVDLSSNTVPTSGSGASGAIRAGDRWLVVLGTTGLGIAGLAGGSSVVSAGDQLVAIADRASGTATAADFFVLQTNIDVSAGLLSAENLTVASVPANTATSIGSALTTIYSAQFFDSSGIEIGLYWDVVNRQITSNIALTNVAVRTVGLA